MRIKKLLFIIITSIIVVFSVSCSDMNDKHSVFMQEGEIIYLGRVDSVRVYGGKNRFLVRYLIPDLRVKLLKIYWNQKADSLLVPIPPHQPSDSLEIIIGNEERIISEGNHVIQLFCTDGGSIRSIVTERAVNVYGDKYVMTLSNRTINKSSFNYLNSEVTLEWSPPYSEKEIGIEITYRSMLNGNQVTRIPTREVSTQTKLSNVDISYPVSYRTMYLPESNVIDTFYSASQEIMIE